MERLEPHSWRDEISCRFWWKLSAFCQRFGGHFWGKPKVDEVLGIYGRECRLCRTFQSDGPPFTSGTTTTNATTYSLTWRKR